MSANPTTDQYLATVKTKLGGTCLPDCDGSDHVVIERTAEVLSSSLPGVDPRIIGEVLLHAAMLMSELNTSPYTVFMPPDSRARFVINCAALAGAQMLTGTDFSRQRTSD